MKLLFSLQDFERYSGIKFYENESQFVPPIYGRT